MGLETSPQEKLSARRKAICQNVLQLSDADILPEIAGATLVDPFTISGNSLGARDWDGRSSQWYTGSADSGHWEDINCGAHFKYDMNNYLSTAGTKYKSVQVKVYSRRSSPAR